MSEGRKAVKGRRTGLGLRVSRRGVVRLVGRLGVGVGGAVAMGGVVASSRTPIVEAADRALDPEDATVVNERRPHSYPIEVRYATDNFAGPPGAAMLWGLDRFARVFPHINVRVDRVGAFVQRLLRFLGPKPLPPPLTLYTGDARQIQTELRSRDPEPLPHLVLLAQEDFLRARNVGGLLDINTLLAKLDSYYPEKHFFVPDSFTDNGFDHSFPQRTVLEFDQYVQFGLPFELSISGFLANASLAESAEVRLPDSEDSWTWDDWTEWDARITDPETESFGTWVRDDYAGQYMPQMYTNGLIKPFDDGLTKTMFDRSEALEAWMYLVAKVHERRTSPTIREAKELAGEFGNPFNAGKAGFWPSDRVGSTGSEASWIKDRFTWTLLPEVTAPEGNPPGHSWSMRSNLVTVSAELEGNVEETVLLAEFLAGETFQERVAIERGHVPVHRDVLNNQESLAPPPEGMKWLKVYADRPDNRSPYPFAGWNRWWRHHKGLAWKGWYGTQSADESLAACQAWGERFFSSYAGPRPYVREPVYP